MNDGFNHPRPEPVNPEPSYPFVAAQTARCQCTIVFSLSRGEEIVYCPMHAAAAGLLQLVIDELEAYGTVNPAALGHGKTEWLRKAQGIVAKARGTGAS